METVIHQFIFAGPRPGLAAQAFQSYWVNFHAVEYAAKIPQIRQYLVALRVHVPYVHEVPFFEGVAEIWLKNDQEQVASLQSPEFLNGARADEPRWAAFWQTLVIDTDPRVIREYSGKPREFTKIYVLLKRAPGIELDDFQEHISTRHSVAVVRLPGIERYLIGFARSCLYGLGEPRFDAVEVWSFNDADAAQSALTENAARVISESLSEYVDERYIFTFVGREHWIIPPGQRL